MTLLSFKSERFHLVVCSSSIASKPDLLFANYSVEKVHMTKLG
jgi:hypothetical protein